MRRVLPLLLLAAGCASQEESPAFFCIVMHNGDLKFARAARELGANVDRDAQGLHIRFSGEPGAVSSLVQELIARESVCCPYLKFRFEQGETLNLLHVSADKYPEALDRIQGLLPKAQ